MYSIVFKDNKLEDKGGLKVVSIGENKYHIIGMKNGEYNVRIYAGDLNDDGDINLHCILNGERQAPIWVTDRSICHKDYHTSVNEGYIDVEFFGKYVCIQGIEISKRIDDILDNVKAEIDTENMPYKINITFSKPSNYNRFFIYKRQLGTGKDAERIEINDAKYTDADVRLGETYEYCLCIADSLGFEGKCSEKISVTVKNKKVKSIPVCDLKVKTISDTKSVISWQLPETESLKKPVSYRIYRKTDLCSYKLIGEIKSGEKQEFEDNSVVTDREYTYGVQTLNAGGYSDIVSSQSQVAAPLRRRQMEYLDRGAIAVYTAGGMFIAFRLNGWEYVENAEFNIYADNLLINTISATGATNYLHKEGTPDTVYVIKKVVNGTEEKEGYTARNLKHNYFDIPVRKPEDYKAPDGHTYSYTANDASVADLDGDGEYEIILKWDCNGKDNSHKGYSGIVYIDAYKLDGTFMWRIDMGKNIRCGAHYTQFMVYDFDGDGYGEMVVKTADGTTDNSGNVVGDKDADWRNEDGFIIEGPEYLSLIDGRTGTIIDTIEYDPQRGNVADWGDSWGNRVDRFLACVAYLDGVHPSVVMCRGYYDHGRPTHLAAYDIKDKKLVKRWKFKADKDENIDYTNQGFHNLAVADVDGDGCDEILYGACVIDHDGTGLYTTGLEHGDAMHVGRFTKDSKGFDFFGIHEHANVPYGYEARNAGTGEITFGKFTGRDTGRGLCAKIDPRYEGNQMWIMDGDGIYNYSDGKKISDVSPASINFAIWWDGDLIRELLDHDWFGYETNVGIPKIYKWNYMTEDLDIVFSTDNVLSNNGTKGNPCLQASIIGDWREEIICRGKDSTFLRVYTTTDITCHRFYTFMHDYVYRLGIAWQNTAYNQPPHTSFYIGDDMEYIPMPDYTYIKANKK